ncbi:hypothetical protein EDD17DRAFT_1034626 [Pisolithus thermaeus]|nr:hypothetical protein EDD17DRAFT_1034626 [Pisolithus thermaeus]
MNTVGPVINHPCTLCCRPTSVWCSRCQNAWYCMPEHLQTDWPRHRRECIPTTHMQNYNMIATPPPAEQQMITVPAILFESGASTTSPTGSNVRYKMNSPAGSLVSKYSIPYSHKSTVMSIENHGLHDYVANRRSYTLMDAIPTPPEAHKQATQKQFTDCSLSPRPYSASNGREHFEPIGCGATPEHFQNMQIVRTSTHGYNDACYVLDSHDGVLEHHCRPTRYCPGDSPTKQPG